MGLSALSVSSASNQSFPQGAKALWAMRGAVSGQFGIDLYWLPLGAGGNFVRFNGRVYEFIASRIQGRPACDLYHSGLEVHAPDGRYVIEQTPVAPHGEERGVVGVGPIAARWAWRLWPRLRYELRCWKGGVIPDVEEAVESPRRLSGALVDVKRLLELTHSVPMLVWGRDELQVHDMWNSNSQIAWLLARTGLDLDSINPPAGGRAPGWNAGVVAAALGLSAESSAGELVGGGGRT